MDVHGARQLVDANAGHRLDHTQRPYLRAAHASLLFNLVEMGFDSIEDTAKLAQHPCGRGAHTIVGNLSAGSLGVGRSFATSCCSLKQRVTF